MAANKTDKAAGVTTKEVAAHLSKTTGRKISAFALRTYLRQPGHHPDKRYTRYSWPSLQDKEIRQLESEIRAGKLTRPRKAKKVVAKGKSKPAAKKVATKKPASKSKAASSPKPSPAPAPAASAE